MQQAVIGVFPNYGKAEAAVRDLELAGIVGAQVEVISNADLDARTAAWVGKASRHNASSADDVDKAHSRRKNDPATEEVTDVRDFPGDQPDFIGRQEFYATHVHETQTVIIVRGDSLVANTAKRVLASHGAKSPSGEAGPSVESEDNTPRQRASSAP